MFSYVLESAYQSVAKDYHIDALGTKQGFLEMVHNENAYRTYVKHLAEGIGTDEDVRNFAMLAKNIRMNVMHENSSFQVASYEKLTLPILRNFFPRLISKELVNIMPIDKPDVIKTFLRPKFRRMVASGSGAAYSTYNSEFPSLTNDISKGPDWGFTSVKDTSTSSTNILTAMGLDSVDTHIQKTFKIVGITDSTTGLTSVEITPGIDGLFSQAVVHANADTDIITGYINYETGVLYWNSETGNTSKVTYRATAALEKNTVNSQLRLELEKIVFKTRDRRIEANWSSNLEQDVKALYDINLQSEMVNILGEQIALDIDREIINDLFDANTTQNPSSHTATFYKGPRSGYALTIKEWYDSIQVPLSTLSAQIQNSTSMNSGNTIACNPTDAAILESVNNFEYVGNSSAGGDYGYKSATVGSGKWKVLTSQVVPVGKMLVKYRSNDLQRAAYVFAPYVPAVLMPYPAGNNPSMTLQSRYATKVIRPLALAQLTISDATHP